MSPLHTKLAKFCSSFARYVDKHRSTAATKGEDIKKGFIISTNYRPVAWSWSNTHCMALLCKSINLETQLDNLVLSSVINDHVPQVITEFTFLLRVLHFSLQPKGLWDLGPEWSHIYIWKCFSCIKCSGKYFSSNFPLFCGSWFQIPPAACLLPEKDFPGFSQKSNVSIFWAAANLWNTIST